jgi:hypothetical protein
VEAPGFQSLQFQPFDLGGGETKRLDGQLNLTSQATTVNVESAVAVVQTDTSIISETKVHLEEKFPKPSAETGR